MEPYQSWRNIPRILLLLGTLVPVVILSLVGFVLWRIDRFEHLIQAIGSILVGVGLIVGISSWRGKSRSLAYQAGWSMGWGLVALGMTAEPRTLLWALRWCGFAILFISIWLARRNTRKSVGSHLSGPPAV